MITKRPPCEKCGKPIDHIYGLRGQQDRTDGFIGLLAIGFLIGLCDVAYISADGPSDWQTFSLAGKIALVMFGTPLGWSLWAARLYFKIQKYNDTYCRHSVIS